MIQNAYLAGLYDKAKEEGKLEGNEEGRIEGKLEGKEEGRIEGKLEGVRELMATQLSDRFGELPDAVRARLATLDQDQLRALSLKLLKARSLKQLGLMG